MPIKICRNAPKLTTYFIAPRPLPQPRPRPATILSDEFNTGGFQGGADCFHSIVGYQSFMAWLALYTAKRNEWNTRIFAQLSLGQTQQNSRCFDLSAHENPA
ncbi:MAG: hypothetical protein ACU0DI_07355 [Paracoccaceae bacterium]